jgi:acyl-CoA synthetase (AMP-forming)/AMP-acid ligase II
MWVFHLSWTNLKIISDRSDKDIIIRGGENIHSTTVENALYEHPEIIDAAVVSVPDHRLGELVAAVVKLESGSKLTEQDIIAFTKTK